MSARLVAVARSLPPWLVALAAVPAGLGFAVWIGVLPRDIAGYAAAAIVAEVVVKVREYIRGAAPRPIERTGVYQVIETSGTMVPVRKEDP